MTQIPQDDFETCLEKAEAWMKSIHERLKVIDNTQGPRSALEARLRETVNICSLEPDGKLLLDMVLTKAKTLLSDSSEEEKHEILVKQGKIKTMFEETTTYMTHCHSRIEWVWLHWNEYLRAQDEFKIWVHNMTVTLEPDVELQLGLKEKSWQYQQALVLQRDVSNQLRLLDRLLEEAASLYNRIGDPSVDESVQSAMMAEYKQIKKKTKDRVSHLEKVWRDHEAYETDVDHFKTWLNSVIEKLKCCIGAASESTEQRLNLLREIGKDVECGEKQLEVLEGKSVEVIKNTSPLGAEKIHKELEELRRTLAELKQMNNEEEDSLLKTYNSENAFLQLARQLQANIVEFRKAIQRLEESLGCGDRVKSEDELLALWKTLNATKSALAAEEAKAERVKVQLKDLFKFSKDVQPLSDEVIAAMRDYQRAKSKAFKLSTETESELRQLFQNPLREFLYWKPIAESVLDSTAVPVNDSSMNQDSIDNIERLLGESSAIKEKLAELVKKKDRILSVLGDDKTSALLSDISAAEQERDALHRDLLQRKVSIQNYAAASEEFESAFKLLRKKLAAIRVTAAKENEAQPDIIGKEAQLNRLQTLLEDITKLHTPIKALSSMTESNPNHAHRANQLSSDYLMLQRSLENNIRKSKENISEHWQFTNALQDLQHWIMVTRGTLEAYRDGSKDWADRDLEALLSENSGKDVQRHQVEAQGQQVMESSSPEGAAVIHTDIKHLHESWESLQRLFNQLFRMLKERQQQRGSPKTMTKPTTVTINQTSGFSSDMDSSSTILHGRSGTSKEVNISSINCDDHVSANSGHNGAPGNQAGSGHRGVPGKHGFIQGGDYASNVTNTPDNGPKYKKQTQGLDIPDSSDRETWRLSVTGNPNPNDPGFQQSDSSLRVISPGHHGTRSTDQSEAAKIQSQADGRIDVTGRVSGPSHTNFNAARVDYGKVTRFVSSDGNSSIVQEQSVNRNINTKRSQGHTGTPGSTTQETYELKHRGKSEAGHEQSDGSARFISPGHGKRTPSSPAKNNKSSETMGIELTSSLVTEKNVSESEGQSPSNPGTARRNRKHVSLAESVDIVDSSSAPGTGGDKTGDDHMKLLMEFEQWLQAENSKLSRICAAEITSSDGIQTRQSKLQKLQRRVPQGQKLLKSLLLCRPSMSVTEDLRLEDLRYRWMLYKSKLRDSENNTNLKISEEPRAISKKSGGICSFLHRVCCAALPLQLLLLLLLLLMFLLPLLLETKNCALSNNFAHSFNLMLKYEGPPPT